MENFAQNINNWQRKTQYTVHCTRKIKLADLVLTAFSTQIG